MPGRLAGKVAVITGAGSGIGRATARRFTQEGAALIANDIAVDAVNETVEELVAQGARAQAVPGDVTRAPVNKELAQSALDHFGALDVFFCNAGGALPKPMLETSDEEYRAQLSLNLDAVWYGAQAALRVMVERGRGVVLATSSGAGIGATEGLPAYGAAKAGVISLMRSIAFEFGRQGIRANAISPGPMGSEGFMSWLDTLDGGRETFETQIPMGRLGTSEEIAEAAVFLASDEARYVSGAVLPVDGAIHSTLASPRTLPAER
ncbi:SDR family oxidoreductase [Myxococcota bacterium]|nr:SDR family oxidoreductase [Myxococcota bacterium]